MGVGPHGTLPGSLFHKIGATVGLGEVPEWGQAHQSMGQEILKMGGWSLATPPCVNGSSR